MKKLLIILATLFSLSALGQGGVKISQMTLWTGSLDSAYVPIVVNLVNYKTLLSRINQADNARIDSIINNWPAGSGDTMRFGYPDEDVATQGEDRIFDLNSRFIKIRGQHTDAFLQYDGQHGFSVSAQEFDHLAHGGITVQSAPSTGTISLSMFGLAEVDDKGITVELNVDSVSGSFLSYSFGAESRLIMDGQLASMFTPATWTWEIYDLEQGTSAYGLVYDTTTKHVMIGPIGGGSGGGIQSMEAANGLSMRNDSTTILGGTLDQTTTVNTGGFKTTWTGNQTTNVFEIYNTTSSGVTGGLYVQADASASGSAIQALGGNIGISATSVAGYGGTFNGGTAGIQAVGRSSTTAIAANFQTNPTSTNTFTEVVAVARNSTGTRAAGIGGYIGFYVEDDDNNAYGTARIGAVLTSVTHASRVGDLQFWTVNSNVEANTMTLKGGGNLELMTTGKAYGLKSPDGTLWYITVNNSGVLSTSTTAP